MPDTTPQDETGTNARAVDQDRVADGGGATAAEVSASPGPVESVAAQITGTALQLTSLAPEFSRDQHQSYLDRLTAALADTRNRNIALTGRYGAGKSSILGKYVEEHGDTTLRLAISSLGPNDEGASLTNRIQKEVVKQLIYSADARTLKRSQFQRPVELGWGTAAWQAAAVLIPLTVALALMGWLPTPEAAESSDLLVRLLVWLVLASIVMGAGTTVRLVTHERFFVSDLSAGGATVKLSEKRLTYFDEYLDLIVNYFDTENIDVVIFEDLDRFDDPQIFEALRELNTLLNGPKRGKARSGRPLRFVYAVRDSLFEQIGAGPSFKGGTSTDSTSPDSGGAPALDDAATAATSATRGRQTSKRFSPCSRTSRSRGATQPHGKSPSSTCPTTRPASRCFSSSKSRVR